MTKKPFVPNINFYSEILPFLQDFYDLNKEKNKNFSYRYMALKLKWSAPYINDVIKGRKKLSLNRALELIHFLELKGANAERFLFLFLSDDKAFSDSTLKSTALATRNTDKINSQMELKDFEKFASLYDYYILYYIDLNKGKWNFEDFLEKLVFPHKPTKEIIDQSFARNHKNGILKYNNETTLYEIFEPENLVFVRHGKAKNINERKELDAIINQEREYIENYLNYTHNPDQANRIYFSGMINLDIELLKEAHDRIVALRNYLYELDKKGQERAKTAEGPEDRVWQFSMNLFSIFHSSEKKI